MKCPKCEASLHDADFEIVTWDDSVDVQLTCPTGCVNDDPVLSFDQEYLDENIG